jgi:SNF2 family DNA or RNA helicase
VEIAKKILETEPAIVIFTNFASVAKAVHEQLAASGWNGELYTGETPQKKRQGMVDNFQVSGRCLNLCEKITVFARLSNLFCLFR